MKICLSDLEELRKMLHSQMFGGEDTSLVHKMLESYMLHECPVTTASNPNSVNYGRFLFLMTIATNMQSTSSLLKLLAETIGNPQQLDSIDFCDRDLLYRTLSSVSTNDTSQ
jgi:hypothetical protein